METDRAERVEIAARIDRIARGLFGGEILGRADNPPAAHVRAIRQSRDAEIGDQCAAAVRLQQDVVGLDVAMNHALGVGIGEGIRRIAQDIGAISRRKAAEPAQAVAQRLARDIAHGVEDVFADLLDRMDRHDVGMSQSRGHPRLVHEPLAQPRHGRALRGQELECHGAIEPHVAREIDDSHPAATELALKRIAPGEGGLEREEEGVGDGRRCQRRFYDSRFGDVSAGGSSP